MFFEKRVSFGERSQVRFVEGKVRYRDVKLNAYAFEVDGVMIDTGSKSLREQFKPFFKAADFDQVVISHGHEDHTGNAAWLQKEFGIPIFMNDMSIQENGLAPRYPIYRQLFWGRREPFHAYPLGETFISRHAKWHVIPTPGHAQDHLSFLNQETGQLFSGDLFVHPTVKVLLRTESVPQIIASLERVLSYDFEELFCCHAGYIANGRKALTKKLNNLQVLRERVLTLNKQGYSEKEITAEIFPKKYPISVVSLGEWQSKHITRSILRGV